MQEDLKAAVTRPLGQIPSGCFIMTAADGGRATGMLASWVQQACFDPPMVSVAVKKGRPIEQLVDSSGHFVLNTLGPDPTPMFKHFGKGFDLDQSAFNGLTTRQEPAGIVIEECLAHLACKVISTAAAGDHRIYIGQVLGGASHKDDKPYVHLRNNGFKY
jgi:flavin reductase (DIM6/NTAB) family NADH-FMN oxidoreductase RutF